LFRGERGPRNAAAPVSRRDSDASQPLLVVRAPGQHQLAAAQTLPLNPGFLVYGIGL
jgi:hypothetical protein